MKSIKIKYIIYYVLLISIISIFNTAYLQTDIFLILNSVAFSLVGIIFSILYLRTGKIKANLLLLWSVPQLLILSEPVYYQGQNIIIPIFDVTQFINIKFG
ncbi:hypothetical protein, partial [Flammeovirga agarivorans]|uniref:hypothetical protein n=1 Tax=Flammeovirga agarivorans TaxID=2726742 RepID=UPI001B3B2538